MNRRLTFSLIILLLLPTFATVSAAEPASIEIDSPSTELTADGALRLSAIVKDSSGTIINERSEEHTSELQSRTNLVCRLLLEKKKKIKK